MQITKIVEDTKSNEHHLNYLTYPWISAPFDEIFVWECSVLYLQYPLHDLGEIYLFSH